MKHNAKWILEHIAGNVGNTASKAKSCKDRAMGAIYRCQLLSKIKDVEELAIDVKAAFMECKLLKRCYDLMKER